MLPRLDMFKEIIVTPRIIAFNESFVPLGKQNSVYPCAVIWHEAIAGRSKDDIISTFNAFFLAYRDAKHVTLWLDNCSSQNKNWSLISFFIYIVNSNSCGVDEITVKYFEPGHTYMAADAFHHQGELSLKKKNKVYDFGDFSDVVQKAKSSKVNVINMQINQFFDFIDYTSKYKLQKLSSKVYLKDIILLRFKRQNKYFSYKTSFSGEYKDVKDIFNAKYLKGSFLSPTA